MTKITTACLIDDDSIYVYTTRKLIEKYELCTNVLVFGNGQEAINYFSTVTDASLLPQVVFLDINMPVMNGWDFIQQFTQLPWLQKNKLDLYVASSSIDNADMNRARSFSIVRDYITKPLSLTQLKELFQIN